MKNMNQQWIGSTFAPRGRQSSVHFSEVRMDKAREQSQKKVKPLEEVINCINNTLKDLQMNIVKNPRFDFVEDNKITKEDYKKIKREHFLKNSEDIVWLKFTKDGFIGVVAVSDDINFAIPPNKEAYNEKREGSNKKWKYNTSGIIIHKLGKEWDDSFVLIFPLSEIPNGITRQQIEHKIGNDLIEADIPILDFYSHRY